MLDSSKIKVKGNRLLIGPDETEEVTKAGIILPSQVKEKEQLGQAIGRVLAIGDLCWLDKGSVVERRDGDITYVSRIGEPWAKVGDRVFYNRYSGSRIPDEKELDGFVPGLLVVLDDDIIAVIED